VTPGESKPTTEALPAIEGLAIERLLGRGGFGAVYLATRLSDGAKAAVKVPNADADAESLARLELEGDTLRRLGGEYAPRLHDRVLLEGRPCLVMEFVPLPTLADRLAQLDGGMPLDELARRGQSILTALKAIHALGLVHRDLKPENIFSTDQPVVTRIFDFGLVHVPSSVVRQDTTVGTFMGTPEYMAPEQLDSSAPVDQRADIYEIGAVLYEMLTGRPPFWGNAAEVQQALANRRVTRPSLYVRGIPPALDEVILRCLAKDPVRRHGSIDELLGAFTAAVALGLQAPQPTAAPAIEAAAGPGLAAATKVDANAKQSAARRSMAVVAVRGISVDALGKALVAAGGQLAEVGRSGGVGVFGEKTSENPVRRAVRFADALRAQKACGSVIVDVASVAVRRKPDGGERYVSAAFARLQKNLEVLAADGLYFGTAAADLVPERKGTPLADGTLVAALPPPRDDDELTVVRNAQPPLLGRAEEMSLLLASARQSHGQRRPGLATVISEGGLGKSHLAGALVRELRSAREAPLVLELRAREPIDGEAEGNLRALLARCFAIPDEAPADRGEALLGELGSALWPAAALALRWMTPDAPELQALGAAPGVLRATVSRSVGEALRLRARERPLALILDDAHFADDATLDAIEYATLAEAEGPLWVCVLARPALKQLKPTWGGRSAAHLRLDLAPLGSDDAANLARQLLFPVESVPAATLEMLVAGTHGSPFLLTELVRGLKRDGIVRRDPRKGGWFIASDELAQLPDLAVTDWLAEREIGAMPSELVAHARLTALIGADFAEDEIEGILSELERSDAGAGSGASFRDPDLRMDPYVATRQLVAMGVFKRHRNGRAAFRHTLLRAAVEKTVSESLRAAVHGAAFRYYRGATHLEESTRLPRLALHAAGAGYKDEAAALYMTLADGARRRHAYSEAEALFSRVLGCLERTDLPRLMHALRGRGLMRNRVSRRDAADDLMAALETARALRDPSAEVEILLEAATALDWIGEIRRSRDLVNEAAALLAGSEALARNDLFRAWLLVGEGRALWRFSEGAEAIRKLQEANALAEGLGEAAYEIRVISLVMLGDLLPYHGQLAEAQRVFETVLDLCEKHGDQAHLMVSYINRRQVWIGRGDVVQALEDNRRAVKIGREIGSNVGFFMGEYNLGELLYQSDDCDAAWPHIRRVVEMEAKGWSPVGRPVGLLLEARVLAYVGRTAEARAKFEEIASGQREAERLGQSEGLLAPSERVLLSVVDLCTRDGSAAEWAELRALSEKASVEMEQIEVAEMAALALARGGRMAEARGMAELAVALSEKIPNVMAKRLRRMQAEANVGRRRIADVR
jgi:tetratricopeptide (TPR) repeat protein